MALNYHMLSFIIKCVQEWALGGVYFTDFFHFLNTCSVIINMNYKAGSLYLYRICSRWLFTQVPVGLGLESSR